jgi:ribosomal protein L11 methylase PrmA
MGTFPLVLANLLAAAHHRLAGVYRHLVTRGGSLILGGLLLHEVDDVVAALGPSGFVVSNRKLIDGWVSLMVTRT